MKIQPIVTPALLKQAMFCHLLVSFAVGCGTKTTVRDQGNTQSEGEADDSGTGSPADLDAPGSLFLAPPGAGTILAQPAAPSRSVQSLMIGQVRGGFIGSGPTAKVLQIPNLPNMPAVQTKLNALAQSAVLTQPLPAAGFTQADWNAFQLATADLIRELRSQNVGSLMLGVSSIILGFSSTNDTQSQTNYIPSGGALTFYERTALNLPPNAETINSQVLARNVFNQLKNEATAENDFRLFFGYAPGGGPTSTVLPSNFSVSAMDALTSSTTNAVVGLKGSALAEAIARFTLLFRYNADTIDPPVFLDANNLEFALGMLATIPDSAPQAQRAAAGILGAFRVLPGDDESLIMEVWPLFSYGRRAFETRLGEVAAWGRDQINTAFNQDNGYRKKMDDYLRGEELMRNFLFEQTREINDWKSSIFWFAKMLQARFRMPLDQAYDIATSATDPFDYMKSLFALFSAREAMGAETARILGQTPAFAQAALTYPPIAGLGVADAAKVEAMAILTAQQICACFGICHANLYRAAQLLGLVL